LCFFISSALGLSRPDCASGKPGMVRYAAESGSRTVAASSSPPRRRADDRHASVEQLSVLVVTAIASACLVNSDKLADIKPSLENDANIVPMPPD
jgi:hypothetical protein